MKEDNDPDLRDRIFETLQASAAEDEDLEGAMLLGFVVLAEWQAPDRERWLSKVSGDHSEPLPPWRERMFAYELAFHWENSINDDDEGA